MFTELKLFDCNENLNNFTHHMKQRNLNFDRESSWKLQSNEIIQSSEMSAVGGHQVDDRDDLLLHKQ